MGVANAAIDCSTEDAVEAQRALDTISSVFFLVMNCPGVVVDGQWCWCNLEVQMLLGRQFKGLE